jgi:uncharacterized membrane protein YuzA (DUF378 family)
MNQQQIIILVVQVLLIAGALNWGSVAFDGTDYVKVVTDFSGVADLHRYIKFVVAAAGLYSSFQLYKLYA